MSSSAPEDDQDGGSTTTASSASVSTSGAQAAAPRGTAVTLERSALAPGAGGVPSTGVWTQIGPAPLIIDGVQQFMGVGPVAGEVTGIAIDPSGTQDQVIFIASNDGGIWKSTDGGSTWTPKTDTMPSLSMGAVAIDPGDSNVIYAGTGNFFGNQFRKGVGIYKSADGGDNWGANAPSFNDGNAINPGDVFSGLFIKKIAVPAPNLLLVATDAGLFRSVDGGVNFGANPPNFDDGNAIPIAGISNGDITDLAVDTVNSAIVYVAVSQQGMFKSGDSGANFMAADKLWPSTPLTSGPGNVFFAQSGSGDSGQTIYVSATVDPGVGAQQYLGFFKSTDGGASFAPVAGTNAASKANEAGQPQVGYDHVVAVDPNAADLVYLCFQEIYVSNDGGVNFGVAPTANNMTGNSDAQTHWDNHVLAFSPPSHVNTSPTPVYVGNDGGLVRSDDGGNHWANLNAGVATCLFLGIDIGRGSATNNVWTYGGCQDNGTIDHRDDSSSLEWHLTFNGDGGKIAVDPNDPRKAYGSSNGGFLLTTDGGLNWDFTGHGIPQGVTCTAVDPNDSTKIYAGVAGATGPPPQSPQIFFSSDSATSFTSVASFAAAGQGGRPQTPTSIAIAPADSQTIYVSTLDGTIQKTTDGGANWSPTTATGAPSNMIAEQAAVDPTDANRLVVVYSALSGIDPAVSRTKHVFLSADGGSSWTDASGTDGAAAAQNLPDLPLLAVAVDPDTSPNHAIIVAGDGGVFWSLDNGGSWQHLGSQLPNAECRSLALDRTATPSLLRVGTFGRSVFELVGPPQPQVTGVSPAGTGTVDVTVTTPAGTSATSGADQFTYN